MPSDKTADEDHVTTHVLGSVPLGCEYVNIGTVGNEADARMAGLGNTPLAQPLRYDNDTRREPQLPPVARLHQPSQPSEPWIGDENVLRLTVDLLNDRLATQGGPDAGRQRG